MGNSMKMYFENLCGITFRFEDKSDFYYNPHQTEEYKIKVGLKDNPTDIPEGKIPARFVLFRQNRKLFDEVVFFGKEEFSQTGGLKYKSKTQDMCLKQVMDKHREKLKKKYGYDWDICMWWEYSIFNFKKGLWTNFRHIWGRRIKGIK
jgi:hypothetical protein